MNSAAPLWPKTHARIALAACAVAAVVGGLLAWQEPHVLWQAYLVGLVAWWFLTIGAAGLLAVGHLTGGGWVQASRPALLAAMSLTPLFLLLFVPVAWQLQAIYPWAPPDATLREEFGDAKAFYLSPRFFLIRAGVYLVVCWVVAWSLNRAAFRQPMPAQTPAVRRGAAISLVVLLSAGTMAAFDWGMSLEPHWYSSIYGAILAIEGALAALAAATLAYCTMIMRLPERAAELLASEAEGHASEISPQSHSVEALHDLGKLLLAFIVLAAYMAFSQLLIIWSGDLPAEISWYLRRATGGWLALGCAAYAVHIAAPFAMLLSRNLKRTPVQLAQVAMLVLASYFAVMIWLLAPAFSTGILPATLAATAAIVALGGAWWALFVRQSNAAVASLVPQEAKS